MKNKKDIVFISILISLFNVNKEYGKEAIEQKNNIVVRRIIFMEICQTKRA